MTESNVECFIVQGWRNTGNEIRILKLRPEISKYLAKRIDGFRWAYVSKQSFMSAERFPECAISTYGCSSRHLLATGLMFSRSYSAVFLPALQRIFSNCRPHPVHYLLVAAIRRTTSTNTPTHFTIFFLRLEQQSWIPNCNLVYRLTPTVLQQDLILMHADESENLL